MPDYLPAKEASLVTWSNNFNTRINATPTAAGLTAMQAAAYTVLHDGFVDGYNLVNGGEDSTPNVVAKNIAKKDLIAYARKLVKVAQGYPEMTDIFRAELLITIPDRAPSPRPAPTVPPIIEIVSVNGRFVRVRLRDKENPSSKGRPKGIDGANIWSYTGETPPNDIGGWKTQGQMTRTLFDIAFYDAESFSKVWLTAFWYDGRGQNSPAATPVALNLGLILPLAA